MRQLDRPSYDSLLRLRLGCPLRPALPRASAPPLPRRGARWCGRSPAPPAPYRPHGPGRMHLWRVAVQATRPAPPLAYQRRRGLPVPAALRYTSSRTSSAQWVVPREVAVWTISVSLPAPCQWRSLAPIQTTSPVRMVCGASPASQTKPLPDVACRICPCSCVCQNVRAPGVKHTLLTVTLSMVGIIGSAHTTPLNVADRRSDTVPALPWNTFIASLLF